MDREFRPYYMQYPIFDRMNEAREERRDIEYMKCMYPKTMRHLQEIVEDECNKLEYDGSMMFDEYPDHVRIRMIVNKIYDRYNGVKEESLGGESCRIKDVISVMLFNEMYRRRCRRRRCRRWY